MRILQVTSYLSRSFGGPVRAVKSTSKELARNHEVTVYTSAAADYKHDYDIVPRETITDGYRIVSFPRILKFTQFSICPSMVAALRHNLSEFDVVHLHGWRQFQDIA